MYVFLDYCLFGFHLLLVAFNLFGWIWHKTRRLHLIVILSTMLSWFVLGLWYGIGYCPFTDWHWQVKRQLGEENLPGSYIKYYLDGFTRMDWNPFWVDFLVGGLAFAALSLSIYVNLRRDGTGGTRRVRR